MLGGGVVVVLAAMLWLVYLIPTWLRRREYMATERNAVRLQQTLRILAEAAEVPEEIRVEVGARDVAETQKALRKVQQRAVAEAKERAAVAAQAEAQLLAEKKAAADAQARAEQQATAQARAWAAAEARARMAATRERVEAAERKARAAGAALPVNVARSIRRGRVLASSMLFVGVLAIATGVVAAIAAWGALLILAPIAVGAAIVGASLTVLGRLAKRVTDARRAGVSSAPGRAAGAAALYDHAVYETPEEPAEDEVEYVPAAPWTPQPLPRPLHLSRGTAAAATMASLSAAAELRRAALRSELEERAQRLEAQRGPGVAKLPVVPKVGNRAAEEQPKVAGADAPELPAAASRNAEAAPQASVAPDSRYARMGIVGEADATALNLDEALRRRRAV